MREGYVSANKSSIKHVQVQQKSAVQAMQFPPGPNAALLRAEEPTMRSVALVMPPSTALRENIGFPPLKGLERSPSLKKSYANGQNRLYISDSQQIALEEVDRIKSRCKDRKSEDQVANWKVANGSLKCVPDHYILERTSRFIPQTSASDISARISDCLRARSTEASFNDDKAKAKCRTMDYVKFIVRLYSGRGDYSHGVIVEVQRRSGSIPSFVNECTAILDAAERCSSKKKRAPKPPCPVSELACIKGLPNEPYTPMSSRTEPDITKVPFDLVMDDRLDANILGMDTLCTLTDTRSSKKDLAVRVSKELFSPDNLNIIEKILVIIKENSVPVDDEDLDAESPLYSQLKSLALTLMANILNLTKMDSNLIYIIKSQSVFDDEFVLLLIDCLRNVQVHSFEASIAARGLSILLSSTFSPDMKNKVKHAGGVDILHLANDYGSRYNSLLEKETESCLNAFSV